MFQFKHFKNEWENVIWYEALLMSLSIFSTQSESKTHMDNVEYSDNWWSKDRNTSIQHNAPYSVKKESYFFSFCKWDNMMGKLN